MWENTLNTTIIINQAEKKSQPNKNITKQTSPITNKKKPTSHQNRPYKK